MVASPNPPTNIQMAERAYLGSLARRDRRLTKLLESGTEPADLFPAALFPAALFELALEVARLGAVLPEGLGFPGTVG